MNEDKDILFDPKISESQGIASGALKPITAAEGKPVLLPKDALVFIGNGVDLALPVINRNDLSHTSDYERKCFAQITSDNASLIVVGPNLVDYLLSAPLTAGKARPDAIVLQKGDPNRWTLTELYEFKTSTGKSHRTGKKLSGFETLLGVLRSHPYYLPQLLRQSIGEHLEIPAQIRVPDNRLISVTFMFPNTGVFQAPRSPFDIRYRRPST